MSSIKTLVANIVDYAGLFPPAKLPMETVVANFRDYLAGPDRWMLARLIVPTARLDEFVAAAELPNDANAEPWRISALVPPADESSDAMEIAIKAIVDFNSVHGSAENGLAIVDAVEVKAPTLDHIARTTSIIPKNINAFLEVPHQDDPSILLEAIAKAPEHFFAKIRTGGLTQNLIPPVDQVARFIHRCAQHQVAFKATAGLHHPLRGDYRLTYEKNAQSGTMYGFLNVFIAACLAFDSQLPQSILESVLSETDIARFHVGDSVIGWGEHSVDVKAVESIRDKFAISFGSCSFEEPTQELSEVGLLKRVL